jgi:phosphatidylglycerophosphate synthase
MRIATGREPEQWGSSFESMRESIPKNARFFSGGWRKEADYTGTSCDSARPGIYKKLGGRPLSGSNAAVAARPWDARLALWLVRPLQGTRVRPNHLTTVRLAVGLAALACLASGWPNLGAWLFVLSNLLDHTDGELARLTGRTSRAGHLYDLATDALLHVLLFAAIGFGLWSSGAAGWGLPAGIVAALAVTAIFYLRHRMEEAQGKAATAQAAWFGFEAEDVLYLLPLVTAFESLVPFLIAAAIGAPITAVLVGRQFIQQRQVLGAAG